MIPSADGRRRWAIRVVLLAVATTLAACGGHGKSAHDPQPSASTSTSDGSTGSSSGPGIPDEVVMDKPGSLKEAPESPDILIFSNDTIPSSAVDRLAKLPGVTGSDQFSMAQFYSEERSVTYAAVDPAKFRRFTPAGTASYTSVWDRVADGEMAISQSVAQAMGTSKGYVRMGNDASSPEIHVGAYTDLTPALAARKFVDAVVNEKWAKRLHMVSGNAVVLSTGNTAPERVATLAQQVVGTQTPVSILSHTYDLKAVLTAVITGTTVARAIGNYTYTANADGTINPDPGWVRKYIRTERVPILGTVRCNKVMLPELRAALTEIQNDGLAPYVYHYDGCFVPRFIAHNPASGISNHSFGTAIDINAAQNQRGGRGRMDIRVVRIFRKWGFTWGGDWHYTDPMHFELNRIVKVG